MSEKEKVLDLDSINSPKEGTIGSNESQEDGIRWGVFIPGILFMGVAVILGIFNSNLLSSIATNFFNWSLDNFGWLYQLASILAFIIVLVITFSKFGNIRFGGKDAKPKYSFMTWFAMALTGGIATGIVNWGVNEPLIYFGNVYGELNQLGIEPNTSGAAIFSIARCFYNWTFIPYAIYSVAGLAVAYNYFNKKEKLTVTATLKPLFGERITKGVLAEVIDTLCMLAITLGLA
ncbi:BCCT family transporter, partial [Cetobacterium sp.]